MTGTTKRMLIMFITVLGLLTALFIIATGLFYLLGEKRPDLMLEEELRREYSVAIDVKIMNTSEGYRAFLVPGHVKWDKDHRNLLYNLSDPKEAVLAFIETVSNEDDQALELMLTENSKEYWKRKGYDFQDIHSYYRENFGDIDAPYIYSLEPGEDDASAGMLSVVIKYVSGEAHLELRKQSDGKWRI